MREPRHDTAKSEKLAGRMTYATTARSLNEEGRGQQLPAARVLLNKSISTRLGAIY
jgi:hypothetical protein